jgi:hypothetical protein
MAHQGIENNITTYLFVGKTHACACMYACYMPPFKINASGMQSFRGAYYANEMARLESLHVYIFKYLHLCSPYHNVRLNPPVCTESTCNYYFTTTWALDMAMQAQMPTIYGNKSRIRNMKTKPSLWSYRPNNFWCNRAGSNSRTKTTFLTK